MVPWVSDDVIEEGDLVEGCSSSLAQGVYIDLLYSLTAWPVRQRRIATDNRATFHQVVEIDAYSTSN